MKSELLEIMQEFDLDDCIFLKSEIEKEDWDEVYACADHIASICLQLCKTIEDNEEYE